MQLQALSRRGFNPPIRCCCYEAFGLSGSDGFKNISAPTAWAAEQKLLSTFIHEVSEVTGLRVNFIASLEHQRLN